MNTETKTTLDISPVTIRMCGSSVKIPKCVAVKHMPKYHGDHHFDIPCYRHSECDDKCKGDKTALEGVCEMMMNLGEPEDYRSFELWYVCMSLGYAGGLAVIEDRILADVTIPPAIKILSHAAVSEAFVEAATRVIMNMSATARADFCRQHLSKCSKSLAVKLAIAMASHLKN